MLSFFTTNVTKISWIVILGLVVGLSLTVVRLQSTIAINHQLELNITELKRSLADALRVRDEYIEKHTALSIGIEEQRILMESVRGDTLRVLGEFGKLSNSLRTDMTRVQRSLTTISKQQWTDLTCDQAIEELRKRALLEGK